MSRIAASPESRTLPAAAGPFSAALAGLAGRAATPVSCRLTPELLLQVDELAEAGHCSRSAVLSRLVEQALLALQAEIGSSDQ